MVLPDGALNRPYGRRAGRRSATVGLAAVTLLLGAVTLFWLTTPERTPPAPPFLSAGLHNWDQVEFVPDTAPYAIIHHRDQFFLFTSSPPSLNRAPSGLQVWRSTTGANWEAVGTVIGPSSQIEFVELTSLGVVAIGTVRGNDGVKAWLSADGVKWLKLMDGLPVDLSGLAGPLADSTHPTEIAELQMTIGGDARVILTELSAEIGVALVSRTPDLNRPYEPHALEIWTATSDA